MKAFITNACEDAGLAAARSLSDAGFIVDGADQRRLPRGTHSRYLAAYHALESSDGAELDTELVGLIEKSRPDVFVPIGTRGVIAAIRCHDALGALTKLNVVDAAAFMAAFDKLRCVEECELLGIAVPKTYSTEDALAYLEHARDPMLVVKPRWDVGAASGVSYVRDRYELSAAIKLCSERYGGFIIQEFIPGSAEQMSTVVLLFAPDSRLAAAFTMRKTRHWPQSGGPTAAARSTFELPLVELVGPFFEKWRWRGAAEVELKLDERDRRHKLIEINPRFPGYLRFPWHCGLDLPVLAAQLALGAASAAGVLPAYRVGATYVAPTLFARTLRDDLRSLGVARSLLKAGADLRGGASVVLGMFADPLPMFVRTFSPTSTRRFTSALMDGLVDR
jgi:predicted ATP-grasp superfamily ATP-dependent carboligase